MPRVVAGVVTVADTGEAADEAKVVGSFEADIDDRAGDERIAVTDGEAVVVKDAESVSNTTDAVVDTMELAETEFEGDQLELMDAVVVVEAVVEGAALMDGVVEDDGDALSDAVVVDDRVELTDAVVVVEAVADGDALMDAVV